MKLDTLSTEKANADLQEFFQTAEDSDLVRVVLILGGADEHDAVRLRSEVRPSDFSSSSEYRGALIGRRKSELKDSVSDTLEALRDLSLHLLGGGEIGRAIVAEGSAAQVADALRLHGVSSAILDRPIHLVRPGRSKQE